MPYPRFKISMPLREVCRSVVAALGSETSNTLAKFSEEFKRFGNYDYIVLTGSGRAGFRLLLESFDLPPGSEIIFPAYTFHIMPVVAVECGFKPVFADVDPNTWNIDPDKIPPLINKTTRAIMPTHLFGVPANMDKIDEIARNNDLLLFEDCAHALGALNGAEAVGKKGDAALFTFAMSKNMPCWGGGAVVVKDPDLAVRMERMIDDKNLPAPFSILRRQFSNIPGILFTQPALFPWTLYPALRAADLLGSDFFDRPFLEDIVAVKLNYKSKTTGLSPFQAAVGLRQLKRFPGWLEKQVKNARYLRQKLKDCPGLQLQQEPSGTRSSFLYVRARVDDPQPVRRQLLRRGIDTKPDDMRNCAALDIFGPRKTCPVAERLGGHCIELPCSHFYSQRQMDKIADRIITTLSEA
ncbi:MAG: aminotransferase class I/II-fold pyridoxal phosphate-dependent enzyme [Candidatus Euphemobacter frigidus]|nr:aminotransferase class I/II-fold pyridoxal phosphate-dependent enzyme [Candidatus Euphemobacter frigidus]MDP8276616.1 aminotransferase class I/II-fold pyridoxal phosphate-dependent enzyme [Candidatus Euphemobacter frigidus]